MSGCGCNGGNVKYVDNAPSPQYAVQAPTRKITTSCDTFGKCGRIENNAFKFSEGGTVSFSRVSGSLASNFPKEQFNVSLGTTPVSSIGLRQLAEEFAAMADELDGLPTHSTKVVLALANAPHVHKKPKKKVAKKKAATKGATYRKAA